MKALGHVFKYGDNVDTDVIIPARYLNSFDGKELASHAMVDIDPEFAKKVQLGDLIGANKNFGCGSSREQAPSVLKALGVKAVIAKSFARIFYRNAINIGLPVIVCKDLHENVNAGDEMELDMKAGVVRVNGTEYACTKLPEYMQGILDQGGLIASLNKED